MVVRCGANSAANCFNIRAGIWSGPGAQWPQLKADKGKQWLARNYTEN
jgi:hypothetical protein